MNGRVRAPGSSLAFVTVLVLMCLGAPAVAELGIEDRTTLSRPGTYVVDMAADAAGGLGQAVLGEPVPRGAVGASCAGDCDHDRVVSLDELIRAVNIALGNLPPEDCSPADTDDTGTVTVAELIQAVAAALTGCTIVQSVGPEGGTLQFDPGIVVEVPPGAVSEETSISAEPLEMSNVQPLLDESGNTERHFLVGVRLEPSRQLNAPVTVTMPLQGEIADSLIPIHYQYDPEYDAYYPAPTSVTVSPEENTITLTLTEFSDHVVAGVDDVLRRKCMESDPCRCGRFTVTESSRDLIYSQTDCQASDISGSITYHDCGAGGITESWVMVEHTEGCVPQLTLTADSELLDAEDTTAIQATVTYLDDPVPGVTVKMSTNDIIELDPADPITNEGGIAETIVTAGTREGVAPVNAEAFWRYPSKIIAINGVEQEVVERSKTMTAETQITVDVRAELLIHILPGARGDFLGFNEQTRVDVAVVDYKDSRDKSQFSYLPGVVVDLQATAGILDTTQVTTSSSGLVSVVYTAPDASGAVTVSGTGLAMTRTASGEPRTYQVNGEDMIDVKPQADWIGSLSLDYTGCGGWLDAELTQCIGYQFAFTVDVDLSLDVDDRVPSPGLSKPNVTGTGSMRISSVEKTDGPLRLSEFTPGECSVFQFQEFIEKARTFPFPVSVIGLQKENAFGTRYDLWLLFNHPSGGSEGRILDIESGENEYCDGVLVNTVLTPSIQQVYWNPAIVFEWDPDWSNDDYGFRLDTTGKNTVTKKGQCGSLYTGQYEGAGEGCSYTLTLIKQFPREADEDAPRQLTEIAKH